MSLQPDLTRIGDLTTGPDLVAVAPSRAERVRAWLVPRRVVALLVLAPLVWWMLADSPARDQPVVVLLLVSAVSALSLASFVPAPGQTMGEVLRSPCSTMGGILPLACAVASLARPGGSALVAVGFLAIAMYQRFSGNDSCGAAGSR